MYCPNQQHGIEVHLHLCCQNKLTVASFSGDTIKYPIYIESDESDSYHATLGDDPTAEENQMNYRVTVSKRRHICENGPNVDLGTISRDVHLEWQSTRLRGENMASRKGSISIQSDDDPIPPTKRRRLQRRQQKLQSTPPVSDSEAIQSPVPQLHDILQRYDCDICLDILDSRSFCNRTLEICCESLKMIMC
jgi:hypothetical protein